MKGPSIGAAVLAALAWGLAGCGKDEIKGAKPKPLNPPEEQSGNTDPYPPDPVQPDQYRVDAELVRGRDALTELAQARVRVLPFREVAAAVDPGADTCSELTGEASTDLVTGVGAGAVRLSFNGEATDLVFAGSVYTLAQGEIFEASLVPDAASVAVHGAGEGKVSAFDGSVLVPARFQSFNVDGTDMLTAADLVASARASFALTWTPVGGAGKKAYLTVVGDDAQTDSVTIRCTVNDDGSFTVPAAQLAKIVSSPAMRCDQAVPPSPCGAPALFTFERVAAGAVTGASISAGQIRAVTRASATVLLTP